MAKPLSCNGNHANSPLSHDSIFRPKSRSRCAEEKREQGRKKQSGGVWHLSWLTRCHVMGITPTAYRVPTTYSHQNYAVAARRKKREPGRKKQSGGLWHLSWLTCCHVMGITPTANRVPTAYSGPNHAVAARRKNADRGVKNSPGVSGTSHGLTVVI